MVLYLDEFSKEEYFCGKILRYYDSLPRYLHEMSVEEIMKRITRNGKRTVYFQKMAMEKYFSWLHQKYGIDVCDKNYELQKSIKYDSNVYVGFYDLKDLKESIESALLTIDSLEGDTPDYGGLIAIFYLEWYGVLPVSSITIKLTDVSNDGKKIFVPAENRTVEILDSGVACYFAEYKHKTGWNRYKGKSRITPYTQDTFYRNTSRRGDTINEKTIYNIRRHFVTDSGDTRFAKKRIYYAGIYFKLFQFEQNYSKEPLSNKYVADKLRELCNNPELSENSIGVLMREYKIYRRNYLEKR